MPSYGLIFFFSERKLEPQKHRKKWHDQYQGLAEKIEEKTSHKRLTLNEAAGLWTVDGHFFQEASGFRHVSNGSNGDCIDRNQAHHSPQLLTQPDLLLSKKKKSTFRNKRVYPKQYCLNLIP